MKSGYNIALTQNKTTMAEKRKKVYYQDVQQNEWTAEHWYDSVMDKCRYELIKENNFKYLPLAMYHPVKKKRRILLERQRRMYDMLISPYASTIPDRYKMPLIRIAQSKDMIGFGRLALLVMILAAIAGIVIYWNYETWDKFEIGLATFLVCMIVYLIRLESTLSYKNIRNALIRYCSTHNTTPQYETKERTRSAL